MMSLFNIFRYKKEKSSDQEKHAFDEDKVNEILDTIFLSNVSEDYLGKAAQARHAAIRAINEGRYDSAWGFLHEQQIFYLRHAQKNQWAERDIVCLDGTVSESRANILRLEQKHYQAFVHILYWIISSRVPIKRHPQKLNAYFRRCKFKNTTLDDVERFIEDSKTNPDLVVIQSKVNEWVNS